jgi:cobalamin transport system substrate-binding protein
MINVLLDDYRPRTHHGASGIFFRIGLGLSLFFITLLSAAPMPSAAPPDTRIVIDQMGRRVAVPIDPKRVVSLSPSITENIFAINQQHRLVGITRFSDYPSETSNYPKVGSYTRLDLEKIVALKPDLCIGLKDGNPVEIIDRLASLNIPVFATDPRNLDGVLETILEIGTLLNSSDPANRLVKSLRDRRKTIVSRVAKIDKKPKVFFQIGISPIVSAGNDTFISELIALAGGENAAQGTIPYPRFSKEQVLVLAPDVLIITSMARGGGFESMKKWWSRWPSMPAIKENRIYLMDSNLLDRASPRMIDGLELLARQIHPELFEVRQ